MYIGLQNLGKVVTAPVTTFDKWNGSYCHFEQDIVSMQVKIVDPFGCIAYRRTRYLWIIVQKGAATRSVFNHAETKDIIIDDCNYLISLFMRTTSWSESRPLLTEVL
jgi:hypothetical protein